MMYPSTRTVGSGWPFQWMRRKTKKDAERRFAAALDERFPDDNSAAHEMLVSSAPVGSDLCAGSRKPPPSTPTSAGRGVWSKLTRRREAAVMEAGSVGEARIQIVRQFTNETPAFVVHGRSDNGGATLRSQLADSVFTRPTALLSELWPRSLGDFSTWRDPLASWARWVNQFSKKSPRQRTSDLFVWLLDSSVRDGVTDGKLQFVVRVTPREDLMEMLHERELTLFHKKLETEPKRRVIFEFLSGDEDMREDDSKTS